MKTAFGFLLCIVAWGFLPIMQSSAQNKTGLPEMFLKPVSTPYAPGHPLPERAVRFRIPGKKSSQYTTEDWGTLIDSAWGPGQSAVEQLHVFDTFWSEVDQKWAGFPNLAINWDSLRDVYRPQIGSGLSRGRFYSLMSRMWLALQEHHTYITDEKVDSSFGTRTTWHYTSGVPLLVIGTGWWDLLGAPVTPMPDSSSFVYRVAPGNPLGLEPGDLILGYDGIPWKRLYGQLLDMGVPVSRRFSSPGTTPDSRTHEVLSAVGWNWGLFDTIDVVKYSTGDTLHLATAPLATLAQTVCATDQVPIAGVPMPQGVSDGTAAVSWGMVQGTNIGYVYVWDWSTESTPQLFHDAIYDLRNNRKVEGLVIDFRTNWGGTSLYANTGLSQLFGSDPTFNLSLAERNSSTNHMSFSLRPTSFGFVPAGPLFDRPIAVLIGPACLSAGDNNAFRMHFHPMARFFGRPTNGASVGAANVSESFAGGWKYQIPTNIAYSNVPGEGYLIHKGVQPDELVWLTPDGAARGEDDVVKRALEWISTLTHAHEVTLDRACARPALDSIRVTAILANPLRHVVALSALVTETSGTLRDSIVLYNDGSHGDGSAGDSVWGRCLRAPSDEGLFDISFRTDDITTGTSRRLPNAARFTTAGPMTLDSVAIGRSGMKYWMRVYLRNRSSFFTLQGATVSLKCSDPWVETVSLGSYSLPAIGPGEMKAPASMYSISCDTTTFPGYFNVTVDVAVGGWVLWNDSTRVRVTGVNAEHALPTAFALEQNYPNPFNPSTTIRYGLPSRAHVALTVYNTLGQQVSVLQNGEQETGFHEVKFDAKNLPSGVYFYRMQAGSFVETRRLILLR
jgi:hypothetical protein